MKAEVVNVPVEEAAVCTGAGISTCRTCLWMAAAASASTLAELGGDRG